MITFLLTIAALVFCGGLGLVFLRTVWFHRDPKRVPSLTEDVLIAPADGMVVYTRPFQEGRVVSDKLGEQIPITEILHEGQAAGSGWMLGIYMSPLDVHFNYAPCGGVVESIHHKQAELNLPMIDMWEYVRIVWFRRLVQLFGRRFHLENERSTFFLQCGSLRLAVVLIADKFVSKIQTFVSSGDSVRCADKLAFIGRGSQADVVIFDQNVELTVAPGQRVRGGETVIAKLKRSQRCDA